MFLEREKNRKLKLTSIEERQIEPNLIKEKQFKLSLNKYLKFMTEAQIKDQVLQVLNYSDNILGTLDNEIVVFASNFSDILNRYIKNDNFKDSLKNSIDCMFDADITKYLEKLKVNDRNSFLQVPIISVNHLFGTVIYKIDDDNFKFVLINKGERGCSNNGEFKNDTCEAYIISKKNIKYIIENCLLRDDIERGLLTSEKIYDIFNEKGKKVLWTKLKIEGKNLFYKDIKLSEQKQGNCFYKNTEALYFFALNNALEQNNFNKKKNPISKEKFHLEFINNIRSAINTIWEDKEAKDRIIKFLDNIANIYISNKAVRKYCKDNPNITPEEKRIVIIKNFLGGEEKDLKALSNDELETKLQESLKRMDQHTLVANMDVFELTKEKEVFEEIVLFWHSLKKRTFKKNEINDFLILIDRFIKFKDKYYDLANVALDQLSLTFSGMICDNQRNIIEVKDYEFFEKILDKAIALNSYNVNALVRKQLYDEVLKLVPNDEKLILSAEKLTLKEFKRLDYALISNSKNLSSKYYMLMGKVKILKEIDKEELKDFYQSMLREKNKNAITYFNLGLCAMSLDEEDYKIYLKKSCELENRYRYLYAKILCNAGEFEEAISEYDKILNNNPHNLEALMEKSITGYKFVENKGDNVTLDFIEDMINTLTNLEEVMYDEVKMVCFYRGYFYDVAHQKKLGIENALENAKNNYKKVSEYCYLYDEAIDGLYKLGEVREALKMSSEYETIKILKDMSSKIQDGSFNEAVVSDILKDVIDNDNIIQYDRLSKNSKIDSGIRDILINVIENVLSKM